MDTTFEGLLIYEDEMPSTSPSRRKNTWNFAVGLEGYSCCAANLPVTRKEQVDQEM